MTPTWEEVEKAFAEYEKSWRELRQLLILGLVLGFIVTPFCFVVGIQNVVQGRTFLGFVLFVLCGIDARNTIHSFKVYRRESIDFEKIKVQHMVARDLHYRWEEESKNEGND